MGLNGSNIEFAKTINIYMVSRFKLSGGRERIKNGDDR